MGGGGDPEPLCGLGEGEGEGEGASGEKSWDRRRVCCVEVGSTCPVTKSQRSNAVPHTPRAETIEPERVRACAPEGEMLLRGGRLRGGRGTN
jgi:hypothetical protein